MSSKHWSDAEVEVIDKIIKSGRNVKDFLHLLPNRSYKAINCKISNMAIKGREPKTIAIRDLMADGVPRSSRQIASVVEVPSKYVTDFMRRATDPVVGQEMHVCGFEKTTGKRIYAFGPGANVDVPRDRTTNFPRSPEPSELTDSELDAKYRASAKWWPKADQLVLQAMTAMVASGRAHQQSMSILESEAA